MSLLLASCVGSRLFGMDPAELLEKLESGEELALFQRSHFNYKELTSLGPGALLFLSMHAEKRGEAEAQEQLLTAALKYESGLYRLRAAQILEALYKSQPSPARLVELYRSNALELDTDEHHLRLAESLSAAGQNRQALPLWRALQADLPAAGEQGQVSRISGGLIQCLVAEATSRPEANSLSETERQLLRQIALSLLELRSDSYLTQTFARLADLRLKEQGGILFSEAELALFALREAAGRRDYGPAVRTFLRYVAIRNHATELESRQNQSTPESEEKPGETINEAINQLMDSPLAASRHEPDTAMLSAFISELPFYTASDLARSWLFADLPRGAVLFRSLAAETDGPTSRRYLYNYYAGRFERSLNRNAQANAYFRTAAGLATNTTDRDAAWWYLADGQATIDPAGAIATLAEALPASDNPAWYSDVIEVLHRTLLLQRNGRLLAALDAALAQKAEASLQANLNYSLARASDLGIISQTHITAAFGDSQYSDSQFSDRHLGETALGVRTAYSQSRYRLAQEQTASTWYRILAAFRLGLTIIQPPIEAAADATEAAAATEAAGEPGNSATTNSLTEAGSSATWQYLNALSDWKLDDRLYREAVNLYPRMEAAAYRLVATRLSERGDYANSVRVISRLINRPGHQATRADRELNWPLPFQHDMDTALAASGVDRSLMYGLVRSESLFMPAVVSRAGAIGLAQLMPATAEEMAGRLRMREWDSTKPADNLLIGAAYLKRLLDANNSAVMPALFSYNAGPGRFRTWRQAAGNLPSDLLLETLSFAETRQYGRNVGVASLNYAVLYEKKEAAAYVRYLLNEE